MTPFDRLKIWLLPSRTVLLSAAFSALIVVVLALLPWGLHRSQLAQSTIPAARIAWIPAAPDLLPRYSMQGQPTPVTAELPIGNPAPVQIFHRFQVADPNVGPIALLLPPSDGRVRLFVNGIRQNESAERYVWGNAPKNPKRRLWVIPSEHLHAGVNRIDILVSGAMLKPLRGAIYIGPPASLEPAESLGARMVETGRNAVLTLSALALALNIMALAVRASGAHLAIAALFAACWTRFSIADAEAILGRLLPVLDQLLVAAMLLCAAFVVQGSATPSMGAKHRTDIAILSITGMLGLSALIAMALEKPGAVPIGASAVAAACVYLAWHVAERLSAVPCTPRYRQLLVGCVTGPGAVALIVAGTGATGVHLPAPPFAPEIALSFSLAALAAIATSAGAIEAARRLYVILRNRIDQGFVIRQQKEKLDATKLALNQVSREAAILEERHRMARDVHDGIGGQLASLIAQVRLRRVSMTDVERALMGGLSELRLLVDSLDLVGETLADALSALLVRLRQQTAAGGIRLEWNQAADLAVEVRDPRWILNLYRLIQEAVSNAVRHSGGSLIAISVDRLEGDILSIRIEDNGRSFDSTISAGGRGLVNMAHRATELGGGIDFGTSDTLGGAIVCVKLPIPDPPSNT